MHIGPYQIDFLLNMHFGMCQLFS